MRIAKGDSMFCYPEYISEQMSGLFVELKAKRFLRELTPNAFAVAAARFLSTLNAIHPFRDGNGRAQPSWRCSQIRQVTPSIWNGSIPIGSWPQ